jgi:hypothetical protein
VSVQNSSDSTQEDEDEPSSVWRERINKKKGIMTKLKLAKPAASSFPVAAAAGAVTVPTDGESVLGERRGKRKYGLTARRHRNVI